MLDNLIKLEKGDCRYCGWDCDGEHSHKEDKEFIDICDDCLNDKLAKEELKEVNNQDDKQM